jgi:hypothetical protein
MAYVWSNLIQFALLLAMMMLLTLVILNHSSRIYLNSSVSKVIHGTQEWKTTPHLKDHYLPLCLEHTFLLRFDIHPQFPHSVSTPLLILFSTINITVKPTVGFPPLELDTTTGYGRRRTKVHIEWTPTMESTT